MDFHIASLLPDLPQEALRPKVRSPRAYAISLFVERLNSERGERKALSPSFIAFRMSHLDIEDLHGFYGQCEKADCGFSAKWWHELDTKKDRKPFKAFRKKV